MSTPPPPPTPAVARSEPDPSAGMARGVWAVVLTVAGWLVLSLVVHSGLLPSWLEGDRPLGILVSRAALWAGLGAGLALLAHTALTWGERRVQGLGQAVGAVVLWLLAGLAFAILLDVGLDGIDALFDWEPARRNPSRPPRSGLSGYTWTRSLTPFLAMSAWGAVMHLLRAQRRLRLSRDRALRAEALAVEARLDMLRHELNPHFLFNALNALIGVIAEDPRRAQTMVRHLAGLLRSILTGPAVAPLSSERELVERYLAIERERFEDRLQATVVVPTELEGFQVPALLIQPLVENAVKHGRVDGDIQVSVEVRRKGESGVCIEVRNRGQLSEGHGEAPGLGVGIRNLRDRLHHLGPGARLELVQQGDQVVARVHLPTEATP